MNRRSFVIGLASTTAIGRAIAAPGATSVSRIDLGEEIAFQGMIPGASFVAHRVHWGGGARVIELAGGPMLMKRDTNYRISINLRADGQHVAQVVELP